MQQTKHEILGETDEMLRNKSVETKSKSKQNLKIFVPIYYRNGVFWALQSVLL